MFVQQYGGLSGAAQIFSSHTNRFSPAAWELTSARDEPKNTLGYFTYRNRYVLSPTVVTAYPPLSLNLSNLFAIGEFVDVYSGTNSLVHSRVHFFFDSNFVEQVHLTGPAAEKFLKERAGTNYSSDLLMVGRE